MITSLLPAAHNFIRRKRDSMARHPVLFLFRHIKKIYAALLIFVNALLPIAEQIAV